jgi:hypothetical protein
LLLPRLVSRADEEIKSYNVPRAPPLERFPNRKKSAPPIRTSSRNASGKADEWISTIFCLRVGERDFGHAPGIERERFKDLRIRKSYST